MPTAEDFSLDPVNRTLTAEDRRHFYRQMIRMRSFEIMALRYYQGGHMGGFLIAQIGQESIPVAVRSMMEPQDHSIGGLRGIGTALVAGMSMKEGMAELFGRATGCAKGKGGLFGFFAPEHHHWGGHGYAATQTALAAGLAFGTKHQGIRSVVFCYLGDGSVNQGTFHEALNLAGLYGLPVIYLIENNRYAMGTSVARSSAMKSCLAERAAGYAIDWDVAVGNDLYELRAKLQPAIKRARHEHRPSVIEIATYRFEGFTIADANRLKYRSKQEVEDRMLNHDPVKLWKQHLIDRGDVDADDLQRIKDEAMSEAQAAAEFAKASPYPTKAAILEDVYWEVDHGTPAGSTGRHFFTP